LQAIFRLAAGPQNDTKEWVDMKIADQKNADHGLCGAKKRIFAVPDRS